MKRVATLSETRTWVNGHTWVQTGCANAPGVHADVQSCTCGATLLSTTKLNDFCVAETSATLSGPALCPNWLAAYHREN